VLAGQLCAAIGERPADAPAARRRADDEAGEFGLVRERDGARRWAAVACVCSKSERE
jgi:hypothetical protein